MVAVDSIEAVRLLIADVDPANQILTSAQIQTYLLLNGGSLRRAAADALDAIATSEVLISKVIRSQDFQTDGDKVATSLRTQATTLRALALEEESLTGGVSVIEYTPPQHRAELTELGWGSPGDLRF